MISDGLKTKLRYSKHLRSSKFKLKKIILKTTVARWIGLPGGTVAGNLPADAEDMGSIPGPTCQGATKLWYNSRSPTSSGLGIKLLSPRAAAWRDATSVKLMRHHKEQPPLATAESLCQVRKTQHSQK